MGDGPRYVALGGETKVLQLISHVLSHGLSLVEQGSPCEARVVTPDRFDEAVRAAYEKFHLRKSILDHPLTRGNTGDNTPAVLHVRLVPGDEVTLHVAPKGGGSENMSALWMLTPGPRNGRRFSTQCVMRPACVTWPSASLSSWG